MKEADFESNNFVAQVIARGSFVDTGTGNGKTYIVETTVLRLNHVALNSYNDSLCHCREVYADGEAGDREWQEHKADKAEKLETWESKIKDVLGLTDCVGSVCITPAESEIFTVVHIWKAGSN
jgi:hypothetical protein